MEQSLTRFRDGRRAIEDLAAIQVDVLFLPCPERRVRRQLERRRGRAAIGGAATGREDDHIRAASDLTCRRNRIVAGRVHVDETTFGDRFAVFINGHKVARTTFRHGAERLLEDRRQAARLVAGRWIVVHFTALARRVVLPPLDSRHELFADVARDRTARQQMLGAVNFGGLRQDRGAAVAHEQIDRRAERRIRGDARIAVRSAALQADNDVRCRHRFTVHRVGVRQHFIDHGDAVGNRLRRSARILDRERAKERAFLEMLGAEQRADLVRFAAKTDDQHAGEIHMPRVSAERPPQELHAFAVRVHAAPGAVRQRDDAVDVRKRGQRLAAIVIRDAACDGCGAIDRGQNADVVARRDAAVGAHDAVERRRRIGVLRGFRVDAERVITVECAHHEVVQMNVLAGRNGAAREADDLVVALDRRALRNRPGSDLVSRRHQPGHGEILIDQRCPADELASRDDDIVVGMKPDRECASCQHGISSLINA